MSDSAHLLEASITSALALKPSTVYVVRVENRASRAKWHLRKCFSEFSELRDKVIGLIESTAGAAAAAGKSASASSGSSPATSLSLSSNCSAFDTGSSHTSRSSSGSFDAAALTIESSASFSERFPYLFKQFPRRQLFGSRSKKVIEQRSRALNAFVHQLLLYAREVRQQNQIAVYFGLRGFVEAFFECAAHSAHAVRSTTCFPFVGLNSPSTLAKTQAAAAAAARAASVVVVGAHGLQRRPAHALLSFSDDSESESEEEEDAETERAGVRRDVAAAVVPVPAVTRTNLHPARRFYREFGKPAAPSDNDDTEDDDESRLAGLKKTASCIAHRELREMKTHFTGSHYAPLQAAGASDAWAARVEIAGIPPTASSSSRAHPPSATLAISANRVQQQQQQQSSRAPSAVYATPKSKSPFGRREARPEWA